MRNGGKEQLRLALTSSGIHLEPPGDDCYYFRKGRSRSQVYGDGDPGTSSTPKRPKFDKEMKAEQIRQIQDGLNDLTLRTPIMTSKKKTLNWKQQNSQICTCSYYHDSVYYITHMQTPPKGIQCNPSITDTFGDQYFVRYSEVSPTQGLPVYFR